MKKTVFSLLFFYLPVSFAADGKAKPLVVEPVNTGSILQMIFGLAVVVFLIVGVAWFMRRMGSYHGHASSSMKVLGGMSVGQRERVLLMEVGDTQLLIGTTPGNIRTLHVFDKPVVFPDAKQAPLSFAERLNAVMKNKAVQQ